ncbi:MAG: beta-propeller fold lactonase family protein [Planctomycetota bacterium]
MNSHTYLARFACASLTAFSLAGLHAAQGSESFEPGAVYTITNDPAANEVAIFSRATDGVVTFDKLVPTGGKGTGAGLGNQGAVILTDDERFLLAVNAGSDELSVFRVLADDLLLVDVSPSFGQMPVSITQRGDLVYVVNDTSDSIAGFRLTASGKLKDLPGSMASLSGIGTDPAQIEFGPTGDLLYVSEKASNLITVFQLDANGLPVSQSSLPSQGETPFGFAFGMRGQLFVSEAAAGADGLGSVSSYLAGPRGSLRPLSPVTANLGTATCWVVASPDGRRIFASNTGSDSVSSYAVGFDGGLKLLDAQAANTGAGPLDMALTPDGRFFYVLNAAAGSIGDYAVESDAALTSLPGSNSGLPDFSSGLAAR